MQLYYNPACSKCRSADGLLKERGIDAEQVRYLDRAPTLDELRDLMTKLGIDDPGAMVRTGEAVYAELGPATATADRLLEAIAEHPVLLERPIFVRAEPTAAPGPVP